MAEHNLAPQPFLGGYRRSFGKTKLEEIDNLDIISIACPLNQRHDLQTKTEAALGISLPDTGAANGSIADGLLLVGTTQDQWFAITEANGSSAIGRIEAALGPRVYLTDQTDSWVVLRLSGAEALAALERICPLDLYPSEFPPGSAARTAMAHLGVLIYREDDDSFVLLSASSSAGSFLGAVETSVEFVT